MREEGICPVCNGSGRVPVPESKQKSKTVYASYDKETDTLGCGNCGGQYMYGQATGKVYLRKDNNQPCVHEYTGRNLGRCYNGYTCIHCGDYFTVDSSD